MGIRVRGTLPARVPPGLDAVSGDGPGASGPTPLATPSELFPFARPASANQRRRGPPVYGASLAVAVYGREGWCGTLQPSSPPVGSPQAAGGAPREVVVRGRAWPFVVPRRRCSSHGAPSGLGCCIRSLHRVRVPRGVQLHARGGRGP